VPDFFVEDVRLDAAAARFVAVFLVLFVERFAAPRAVERAVVFFAAPRALLAVRLVAVFLADFLVAAFFVVFLAAVFRVVFLAAVFFALFFAAPVFAAFAAVFRAPPFFADAFLAPAFERELLFVDVPDPLAAAPPVLMSLGYDLSSVGIEASFKGLRVHRHACTRQRRYIASVPTCENRWK
jgi:hypothetical protein